MLSIYISFIYSWSNKLHCYLKRTRYLELLPTTCAAVLVNSGLHGYSNAFAVARYTVHVIQTIILFINISQYIRESAFYKLLESGNNGRIRWSILF